MRGLLFTAFRPWWSYLGHWLRPHQSLATLRRSVLHDQRPATHAALAAVPPVTIFLEELAWLDAIVVHARLRLQIFVVEVAVRAGFRLVITVLSERGGRQSVGQASFLVISRLRWRRGDQTLSCA